MKTDGCLRHRNVRARHERIVQLTSFLILTLATRRVQVLVLSPTRELAMQTENTVTAIGDFMNIHAHACVGGKSMGTCPFVCRFGTSRHNEDSDFCGMVRRVSMER